MTGRGSARRVFLHGFLILAGLGNTAHTVTAAATVRYADDKIDIRLASGASAEFVRTDAGWILSEARK